MKALISVYDKKGIEQFGADLVSHGFELLASGGTAKMLLAAGLAVTDVADIVGKPILGHRVVTLSREVHAGLLATDSEEDALQLIENKIDRIDLVCVDFYPLQEAIRERSGDPDYVLEKTDIGGPTMVRSAAKGRRIVICDPADRPRVIKWLEGGKYDEHHILEYLAAKAEREVAHYAFASARYWDSRVHTDTKLYWQYLVEEAA